MNAQLLADPKAFRNALSSFATGVTVVTTVEDNYGDIGLTANSFNSVSLDPPMILWSLAKNSLSLSAFKAAPYFAVHILGEEQEGISGKFARKGEDKFAGLELARGPGNMMSRHSLEPGKGQCFTGPAGSQRSRRTLFYDQDNVHKAWSVPQR